MSVIQDTKALAVTGFDELNEPVIRDRGTHFGALLPGP